MDNNINTPKVVKPDRVHNKYRKNIFILSILIILTHTK